MTAFKESVKIRDSISRLNISYDIWRERELELHIEIDELEKLMKHKNHLLTSVYGAMDNLRAETKKLAIIADRLEDLK